MSGKPLSLAELLQRGATKKPPTKGISLKNRFDALHRDRSVSAASSRCESPGKRAREESVDSEEVDTEPLDRNLAFKSMAGEEGKFAKAKAIVEGLKAGMTDAAKKGAVGPIWEIVGGIIEWMEIVGGVQETTANVVVDSYNKVAASPRKSRRDGGRKEVPLVSPEEAELSFKKKKFAQEVREAERSSLIFNSNMGGVPVMNPDTMRTRFSMDLAAKAAAVEKKTDGVPSATVAAQLDDALEMVTRMEYFGRVTKKAMKRGTHEPDDFFTIPVKLSFKDKDTRDAAEFRMRTMCDINCTVPYHRTLRNVIGTVIAENKEKYPDNFIQIKVDVEKFVLKVNRKSKKDKIWYNNVETVALPDSVLDLSRVGPRAGIADRGVTMEGVQEQG